MGMLARLGLERADAEDDVIAAGPRVDAENPVIGLADRGVRSSVVRLPSSAEQLQLVAPGQVQARPHGCPYRAFRQPI
jgi:hypothetical protein